MRKIPKNINRTIENIDEEINAYIYKTKDNILLRIELILNNSDTVIWDIYKTSFTDNKDFYKDDHIYKEIANEYRNKWYWKKLLNLWLEKWWILPELEYDNTPTWILFLIKNWYNILWFFDIDNSFNPLNENEIENELKYLKRNISKERVKYTYMFKKEKDTK